VADQTENGSSFRILTLLDEHTRQCLAIHPAWSVRVVDVITVESWRIEYNECHLHSVLGCPTPNEYAKRKTR
jgi:N6-adenosine-specific RNA methylase IME4